MVLFARASISTMRRLRRPVSSIVHSPPPPAAGEPRRAWSLSVRLLFCLSAPRVCSIAALDCCSADWPRSPARARHDDSRGTTPSERSRRKRDSSACTGTTRDTHGAHAANDRMASTVACGPFAGVSAGNPARTARSVLATSRRRGKEHGSVMSPVRPHRTGC